MKKVIKILAIFLLLGVFAFSGYKVVTSLWEYHVGSSTFDRLAEEVVVVHEKTPPIKEPTIESETQAVFEEPTEEVPIEVDFASLLASNGDVVGWLYSEGTPINYPITQAENNLKYLRHLLNGKYNIAGTLFVDYRCEDPFHSRNTVLYGHNLRNDEMFGTLPEYQKEEYYLAHPVIWLLTPNENYKLTVIGGYQTTTSSSLYNFNMSANELKSAVNTVVQKMPYETSVNLADVTRIVTLSTCSYESSNARYILVASAEKIG